MGKQFLMLKFRTMAKDTPIYAAFLDLTIPGGMGGRETVTEMRKKYPNMPIFASSGYSEDPVMSNPMEYGFTDSIRKPYLLSDLTEMLNRNLLK